MEVLKFAHEKGYPDLTSAFKILKEAELREYFASQRKNPNAPVIARPGAGNAPVKSDKKVRTDDGTFEEAFNEMVGGQ
jgi:hypothetical protein